MPKAEKLSKKWTVSLEAKLRGKLWNFEDNLSAESIIFWYTCKMESGLCILKPSEWFLNANARISFLQPVFYLSVTRFCKKSFLVFLDQLKVKLNILLFLGFPSFENKIRQWISDNGYRLINIIRFWTDQFYPMRPHRNYLLHNKFSCNQSYIIIYSYLTLKTLMNTSLY